uniref:Uncharacterized protein n=1 Tax=Pristionchus pacificus TaxID=54126 RepID=A0A2A6BD70_PRIPA|eukprot:PDM63814.1 hypothetical protein PRIPAC_49787 [Pristionchus pacificus]
MRHRVRWFLFKGRLIFVDGDLVRATSGRRRKVEK